MAKTGEARGSNLKTLSDKGEQINYTNKSNRLEVLYLIDPFSIHQLIFHNPSIFKD